MLRTNMTTPIHFCIPYDLGKDLGKSYNETMKMVPDGCAVCFLDGDAMFLHSYFGRQLYNFLQLYPECGLFTSLTNRVNCPYQIYNKNLSDDIRQHREIAQSLINDYSVTDITNKSPLSGMLILIRKSLWKTTRGFCEDGMLGIDNDMHIQVKELGEKVYLMNGVYVYHWYRGGNKGNIKHLLK